MRKFIVYGLVTLILSSCDLLKRNDEPSHVSLALIMMSVEMSFEYSHYTLDSVMVRFNIKGDSILYEFKGTDTVRYQDLNVRVDSTIIAHSDTLPSEVTFQLCLLKDTTISYIFTCGINTSTAVLSVAYPIYIHKQELIQPAQNIMHAWGLISTHW